MRTVDTVVVGGGIAGLGAAALLARGGQRVVLLEGSALGGRARSRRQDGLVLNLGPHALYRAGAARALLDRLGVAVSGAAPSTAALGLRAGELGPLPFDPVSAVTSPMFTASERFAFARWVAGIAVGDPARLAGRSVAEWLAEQPERVAQAIAALVRVSTYSADLAHFDACAALAQLQRGLRGVTYLHRGWQDLVDGLAEAARAAGAELVEHCPIREVGEGGARTDEKSIRARQVLLCVPPRVAAELTGSGVLRARADSARPVHAACLDLAIDGPLPAQRRFALGLDRPLYASIHSMVAAVAPEGTHLAHLAVYGAEGEPDALRAELEDAADLLWPDWRARVGLARWMPKLVVSWDQPQPERSPQPVAVADRPGVWVAGDWVGGEGILADAAAASASEAARAILAAAAQEAA